MTTRLTLVVGAVMALLGHPAAAGPFGYDQGMSREAVKQVSKGVRDEKNWITVKRPPIVNEEIQSLSLQFSKKSGLCFILASGVPFFGFSIEHEFTETVQALSAKYGEPQLAFEPHRGVREPIQPQDWYRAVMDQKGTLHATWSGDVQRQLPDKLRTVRASLSAFDFGKGLMGGLLIGYAFSNHEDCLREQRAERSKGL